MGTNTNISNLSDKKISLALSSTYAVLITQYLFFVLLEIFGKSFALLPYISKGIVFLFFVYALPNVLKRNFTKMLFIYILFTIVILYTIVFFPDNIVYLKEDLFLIYFTVVPSIIYALSISEIEVFQNVLKKVSFYIFLISVVISILLLNIGIDGFLYSQTLSYYVLLPAIMYFNEFMSNKSFKSLLIFITSIFIIVVLGARGPLLIIAMYIIICNMYVKSLSIKRVIIKFGLIFGALVTIIFWDFILEKFTLFLTSIGISSRTLMILSDYDFFSSGRIRLYNSLLMGIAKRPFFGYGIYGDRYLLNGIYAHNIVLEILIGFGMILGTFIILIFSCYGFLKIFRAEKRNRNMYIILLFYCLFPLLISSTYLTNISFWIFIGIIFNKNINKRKQFGV